MKYLSLFLIFVIFFSHVPSDQGVAAKNLPDQTTKYRVYQDAKVLNEFSDLANAISYAKLMNRSYVEEIGTGKWLWNNFSRYQVYEKGIAIAHGNFHELRGAIAFANSKLYRSIRDLQSNGWVWNNYPQYRVFIDEFSKEDWEFATLDEAVREAKKWSRSNIIDLSSHQWVWDNYSSDEKMNLCRDNMEYRVYKGTRSNAEWQYSCFRYALHALAQFERSHILNLSINKIVYRLQANYHVYHSDRLVKKTNTANQAIAYAQDIPGAVIIFNNQIIWNSAPYYHVYQGNRKLKEYSSISEAVAYAKGFRNTSIVTSDQQVIWKYPPSLHIWAWAPVFKEKQGLRYPVIAKEVTYVSPNLLRLTDQHGGFRINTSLDYISHLVDQGYIVHVLISNVFEEKQITRDFLNNPQGQRKFIADVVKLADQLNVHGINVDFENLHIEDRDKYSLFIEQFVAEAHKKEVSISVVLPRGNPKNQLAFDYPRLGKAADFVNILLYAKYYEIGTVPDSQSTIQWVEQGIMDSLSYGIPRHKVFLGVPFFTKVWKLNTSGKINGSTYLANNEVANFLQDKTYKKTWDISAKQYKVTFSEKGVNRFFWLEDENMLQTRIALAKKYKLAGISIWRLGQDYPELWDTISNHR